ncbi:MAG TPA: OB-fold nucleic acid binding domain-containing protein [Thermoflexus sp.]|nr:OB-fold nucleic acid binding domain-containing protein [Thermoflexus sp.]
MRARRIPSIPVAPIIGALALAIAGLLSLWFQARFQPVPTPSLTDLHSRNLAGYVRVHGTITEPPRWDPKGPRLLFRLSDGTADLLVLASGPVAAELRTRGWIPHTGDAVRVEGRMRGDPDSPFLEMLHADALRIQRPEPLPLPLSALATAPIGTRVHITGQIRSVRRPYAGLTLIRLQDESGMIDVAWYEALVSERPELPLGAGLQITGALGLYRDAIQVVLDDPEGWALVPWNPEPRSIAQALRLPDGAWVGIEGTLRHRLEARWILADETGEVEIRLSPGLRAALPETPPVGARLRVWGRLRRIHGEPMLFPELSLDLRWDPMAASPVPTPTPILTLTPIPVPSPSPTVSPTPRPLPTATPFPLPELSGQLVGSRVTVEGVVVDLQGFAPGWALTLEQAEKRLRVFIPTEQMVQVPGREGLYLGATIRATGVLTLYRGELELLPQRGRDIIVRKGTRPEAPLRSIGTLSPSDQGARVRVMGQVLEVAPFSAGLRLLVRDESGALPVILWENVAAMVPDRLKEKGANVEIIGQVRTYRGELQLIPTVPWEVRSP